MDSGGCCNAGGCGLARVLAMLLSFLLGWESEMSCQAQRGWDRLAFSVFSCACCWAISLVPGWLMALMAREARWWAEAGGTQLVLETARDCLRQERRSPSVASPPGRARANAGNLIRHAMPWPPWPPSLATRMREDCSADSLSLSEPRQRCLCQCLRRGKCGFCFRGVK